MPAAQTRRPLFVTAEDVDCKALAGCILHTLRGQLQVVAIKVPGFGDNHKFILDHLPILTHGTVFTDEIDLKLERPTANLLASTDSIAVTEEDMIILDGECGKDATQERCDQFRTLNDRRSYYVRIRPN